MTDSLLNILKFALLALLYLFFARVLWAVWSEVRGPRPNAQPIQGSHRTASGGTGPIQVPGTGQQNQPAKVKSPPRGKKGEVARLVVLEPRASRGTALGVTNEITFGRAVGCTVSVPDDTYVSQVHARVFNDQGKIIVEDLGSTNGTYVNGNRLTVPVVIQRGDRIQIGGTVLEAN